MKNLRPLLSFNSVPAISEPVSKVPYGIIKVAKSKILPGRGLTGFCLVHKSNTNIYTWECQWPSEKGSEELLSGVNLEQGPSRGHEAALQSGLGVLCSSSKKERVLIVRAQARRISTN